MTRGIHDFISQKPVDEDSQYGQSVKNMIDGKLKFDPRLAEQKAKAAQQQQNPAMLPAKPRQTVPKPLLDNPSIEETSDYDPDKEYSTGNHTMTGEDEDYEDETDSEEYDPQ